MRRGSLGITALLVVAAVVVAVVLLASGARTTPAPPSPTATDAAVATGGRSGSPQGSPGRSGAASGTTVPKATPTIDPTRSRTPQPTPSTAPLDSGAASPAGASLAGTWHVTSGSWVGSTVSAGVGPFQSDVVARTDTVEGAAVIEATTTGNVLASSRFTVDTTTLSTGDGTFDSQLQSILETDHYPMAGFEQTSPVRLPPSSQLRAGAQVDIPGNLILHGVTRAVSVSATLTLAAATITVDATIPFRLSDYNIHGSGLVSVGDTGTMSFHLVLAR